MENKVFLKLEVYKAIVLTLIAFLLLGIFLKTPVPFTRKNLENKIVKQQDIPFVRIQGGSVTVDGSVEIDN